RRSSDLREIFDFGSRDSWDKRWMGHIAPGDRRDPNKPHKMTLIRAWSPYVILATLLVVTRVIDGVNEFLTTPGVTQLNLTSILRVVGIDTDVQFFFSPGFILIVSALLGYVIEQMPARQIAQPWKPAGKQISGTAVARLFAVPMVRVLIQSGINDSGLESMPVVLAEG